MSEIKVGDAVWVARPARCCGKHGKVFQYGTVFIARKMKMETRTCALCGSVYETLWVRNSVGHACSIERLEKFRDFPASELRDEPAEVDAGEMVT